MIVHVPMAVHPDVKRVLVIGGGDGGVARELSYYQEIEVIDVVEPDKMFVDVCRKYFPDNACGLDDIRVRVYYEDGLRFLRGKEDEYDLIINDCTDPLGHAAGLFTKEFYGSCYKALHEDGIMVYQHGSPFFDEDEETCRAMHKKAYRSFPISRVYQAHIPPARRGTGCSALPAKNITPSRTSTQALEQAGDQDLVLHHPSAPRRLYAAALCGGPSQGRRRLRNVQPLKSV